MVEISRPPSFDHYKIEKVPKNLKLGQIVGESED